MNVHGRTCRQLESNGLEIITAREDLMIASKPNTDWLSAETSVCDQSHIIGVYEAWLAAVNQIQSNATGFINRDLKASNPPTALDVWVVMGMETAVVY